MAQTPGVKNLIKDMLLPVEAEEQPLGKYRTAAWLRLCFLFPLLYGFTLFSLLRAISETHSQLYRAALAAWIALAALEVALNVAILLTRSPAACKALSMASIAGELTSNEIVIYLTGVAASHALIFIVIAAAVYRVYFDYLEGMFSAVYGAALHFVTVLLYFCGVLPNPPVYYASSVVPGLQSLLVWASTVSLAVGSFIAFAAINLGMNRVHRMRLALAESWKRDLDSLERFNEQVMECPDENDVYAETIKAVMYATPYRKIALLEQDRGSIQVKACSGWNRARVEIAFEDAGMPLPGNNEMAVIADPLRHSQTMYCFSLECNTGNAAYMAVGSAETGAPDAHRRSMLMNIAQSAGDAVNTLRLVRMEKEKSYKDGLTGLFNKRYLMEQLPVMLKNAGEAGEPLGIAMFDIDSFKAYNDAFGHLAGDELLKDVARTVAETLREGDTAARFGGEEFLAVFAGADRESGAAAAERIRAAVERIVCPNRAVSVSGGVASFPEDAADSALLLDCADKRLYRAKREGKNRIYSTD